MSTRYDVSDRVEVETGEHQGSEATVVNIKNPESDSPDYKLRYETGKAAGQHSMLKASQLSKAEAHMTTEEVEANKDKARQMGYRFARGLDMPEDEDASYALFRLKEGHTQSAQWANSTLPELRQLSGFEDSGTGTYTEGGMEEQHILDEMVEAYWDGAYQALQEQR